MSDVVEDLIRRSEAEYAEMLAQLEALAARCMISTPRERWGHLEMVHDGHRILPAPACSWPQPHQGMLAEYARLVAR